MGIFKDPKTGLIIMMWLSFGYFFVEIIVGYITNSMAMVADSFHMLGDVAALVISFMSVKMSPKKWSKNTFGWARAEVLGALVNAVFLIALCFSITIEALKRFVDEEEIHDPKMLLITGGLGLLVNIVGLVILFEHGGHHGHSHGLSNNTHAKLTQLSAGSSHSGHSHGNAGGGHSHGNNGTAIGANSNNHSHSSTDDNENNSFMQQHTVIAPIKPVAKKPKSSGHGGHGHSHGGGSGGNMNMRSVYLHVLSDALGSVIVMISASVVWLTDWKYKHMMDPALSILLVVLMLRSVWPLLRESALILLQTVPTHIQVDAIQQRLLENVDGVLAVHEFHVWQLAGDRIIASAHIRCRNLSEYMKIAEKVKEFFHNEGIHSTTIQPEFVELELQSVTDGVSTNLNISGSHDSCALDCPTTDEGCVQATCCQNNNKIPTVSPTSSPFLCRQRTITSRQSSDIESGSLLTSAIAPPSPISTPATLPLTASASHMAAGPPPAILTATTEIAVVCLPSSSSSATITSGIAAATTTSLSSSAIITPTSIVTNTTTTTTAAAASASPAAAASSASNTTITPPNSTSSASPPSPPTTSGAVAAQSPTPLTSHSQSHLPVV